MLNVRQLCSEATRALKREIVAATLLPGASVSVVARWYDINANQVFSWRRRYRGASQPFAAASPTPGLLPVTITPAPEDEPAAPRTLVASDTIQIEVSGTS